MDPNLRNRAALAFISILGAVYLGYATLTGDGTYVEGTWTVPQDAAPNMEWCGVVRGPSEMWAQLGLNIGDGGSGLAIACSPFYLPEECEADASLPQCLTTAQVLPGGVEYSSADEFIRPAPATAKFRVWVAEHPQAPWRCACGAPAEGQAVDAGPCEKLAGGAWTAATTADMTLQPGQWRNCAQHPCADWGRSYIPAVCCADECEGKACGIGKCGNSCGECADGFDCVSYQCVERPGPDAGLEDAGEDAGEDGGAP